MDAELHRQGFVAIAGGKTWVIEQAAAQALPENRPPSPPASLLLTGGTTGATGCAQWSGVEIRWARAPLQRLPVELYALWHRWTDAANEIDLDLQSDLKANLTKLEEFVKV